MAEDDRADRRVLLPLLPPVLELPDGPQVAASDLLRPRYAVVPFVARGDLLGHIMRWRETDTPLIVLVLTGAGGFGKTRTAAEVCRAAEQAGWTAGPLDGDSDTTDTHRAATWRGRLLIAVDYAETRPELVTRPAQTPPPRRGAGPVRVVLVVRQRGGRESLIGLFATGDAADDLRPGCCAAPSWSGSGTGNANWTAACCSPRRPRPRSPPRYGRDRRRRDRRTCTPSTSPGPCSWSPPPCWPWPTPSCDVAAMSADQLLAEVLDRHEARYWERADQKRSLGLLPEVPPRRGRAGRAVRAAPTSSTTNS